MDERANGAAKGFLAASCRFCAHANPTGSKYCNECGSPLHLRPCRFCNAINDAVAIRCHACGAALPLPLAGVESASAELAAEPVTEVHAPEAAAARWPPRRFVQGAIALLVVVAASSAYFAFWQMRSPEGSAIVPEPAVASGGTAASSGSGAIDLDDGRPPQPPRVETTTGTATLLQAEPAPSTRPDDVDAPPASSPSGGASAALDGRDSIPAAQPDKAAATRTTKATPSGAKRTATAKSAGKSSAKSPPKSARSSRVTGTKGGGVTPLPKQPLEAGSAGR